MTFWNGSHWVDETPTSATPTKASRLHNWAATGLMILSLTAIAVPIQLVAAASHHDSSSGCAVDPSSADVGETYVVSAWGIPTGTAVNLWITEDGVTTGRPLGSTPDGTFNLNEASLTAGVTTYAFSGPVKQHMTMYGTCSVSAY
jgi:hypothetical protein